MHAGLARQAGAFGADPKVLVAHRHRTLIAYLLYGRTARSGQGLVEVSGGSLPHRLPAAVWRGSLMVCVRRSPWRGEAQEGSAQLKVALPSSSTTESVSTPKEKQ